MAHPLLRRLLLLSAAVLLAFAGAGGVQAASPGTTRPPEHPNTGRGVGPSGRHSDQLSVPGPVRAAAVAAAAGNASGAPFLTRPYWGWHSVNSWFDHCNPDYSIDGRICTVDGTVALASSGRDPYFTKGYAVTPGGRDYIYYDGHNGFDLGLYYEELLAAAPGVVTTAGIDPVPYNSCFGNTVVIDHGNGFSTRYAHMSRVDVNVGQAVSRGQHLGISGTTGCSTGPHLHFGLYLNSSWTAIDPWGWLGAAGGDPWPYDQFDTWLTANPHDPVPDAPTAVTAALGQGGVKVTWTPGFDGGGGVSGAAGYTIAASPGGQTVTTGPAATAATFTGLAVGTAYTFTVTAFNGLGSSPASAPSNSVSLSAGVVRLAVSAATNPLAGRPATVQVKAVDSAGATVGTYTGTVRLASSDRFATLPAPYAFLAGDAGAHSFQLTFSTAGAATVTATDAANSALTGSAALTVQPQVLSATSATLYSLAGSDGAGWSELDASTLRLAISPSIDSVAVVTGSSDLWTDTPGYDQDLGLFVSQDGVERQLAWKESGGIAAAYSPNATSVEAVTALAAGHSYVFKLKWKANRAAPGVSLHAGAGTYATGFSPTTLAAELLPAASVASSAPSALYSLAGSDGASWLPLDPSALALTFTPAADGSALLSASADLWTEVAGYNEDLGLFVSTAGGPESLLAWKEGGGVAAGYSPNAVYALATLPVTHGIAYSVRLKWKTNRAAPGVTIHAGAGTYAAGFSPTRLTARLLPAGHAAPTARAALESLSPAPAAWTQLDPTHLTVTIHPTVDSVALVLANLDLWTENKGINQDLALTVTSGGSTRQLAWKESGGAAAYSPNAALVLASLPVSAGSTYTFQLSWKANVGGGAGIHAGAGTTAIGFSPSTLTAILTP